LAGGAAFFGVAFFFGASSSELLSSDELDSFFTTGFFAAPFFLATPFLAFFVATLATGFFTSSSEDESSELEDCCTTGFATFAIFELSVRQSKSDSKMG